MGHSSIFLDTEFIFSLYIALRPASSKSAWQPPIRLRNLVRQILHNYHIVISRQPLHTVIWLRRWTVLELSSYSEHTWFIWFDSLTNDEFRLFPKFPR